jgi:hypothetical protein
MSVGKPVDVAFAIAPAAKRDDALAAIGAEEGEARIVTTRIGRFMSATLEGAAFDIEPLGAAERDLGASDEEQWSWKVTPKLPGPQQLRLKVAAFADDGKGGRTRISLDSRAYAINVKVTVLGRIEGATKFVTDTVPFLKALDSWFGALAGMLGAAGLAWLAFRRFGKGKADAEPAEPPAPKPD